MSNYYENKKKEAFIGLPPEFISYIEYAAYERGHSAGEDEVNMIAAEMAHDLKVPLEAYNKRILRDLLNHA